MIPSFRHFMEGVLAIPGGDDRGDHLQKIIQKACRRSPGLRYQTALEMLLAINWLVRPTKLTSTALRRAI